MKYKIFIIGSMVLGLLSCNKPSAPDCFKKTGSQTSATRTLEPFISVVLDSHMDMTIQNGPEYKVELFGGANMLDEIKTSVSDGTLTITNKNKCNFTRGYKHSLSLMVTCPDFQYVVTNSIGNIYTTPNFHQDTLSVRSEDGDIYLYGSYYKLQTSSHGYGNVTFKGTTNKLFVYMYGTNYLYAGDGLVFNYALIGNTSLAQAYVNVTDSAALEYNISKSGNIYYKGNPVVLTGTINGTGKIIKE